MQKIFLIRHGTTKDNLEKRFCGKTDSRLIHSKNEIRNILLPKILGEDLGAVYSSPKSRAINTALAVSSSYQIIEDLREIDFGVFEGKTYEEINETFPDFAAQWRQEGSLFSFPKGESLEQFYFRTTNAFRLLLEKADKSRNITVFAHGGTIQCIVSYLLSNSNRNYWNFKIDNYSLTKLYILGDVAVFERINY